MKTVLTYLSLAIGLLFTTHLQANHDTPSAARECLLDHFANVSWALDATHHWYFQPDGELLQLNYGQQDYRLGQWQMDATGDEMILDITVGETTSHYRVAPSCDNFELEPLDGTATHLQFTKTKQRGPNTDYLIGQWEAGFVQRTTHYAFQANGQFQITLTADGGYEVYTGEWTLAHDGETLLLQTPAGALEAFRIKYLAMDEMVLEPLSDQGNLAPRSVGEDCFFNKL